MMITKEQLLKAALKQQRKEKKIIAKET